VGDSGNVSTARLIAFPGAPNLPIFAAQALGFFERASLDLTLETTPSSSVQMQRLIGGQFELAATAFDNVVAYQESQGAVELPEDPDLFVFMGATRIELSLVVAPQVRSFGDLRGRPLALDALATGFAFVLYEMLEHAGLSIVDCELKTVGATPQRWQSLRAGEAAATLMIEPFTSIAIAQGFRVLESSRERLPRYQGGIFAARRGWAAAHRGALRAFIEGYLDGLSWVYDPANRDEAVEILLRRMPAIEPAVAPKVIAKLLTPDTGLTPDGAVDREGMRTVLSLRSRYASPTKRLEAIDRYLDLSEYSAVRRARDPRDAGESPRA
jgi:ABC-type nitrate/sulfonate/bicarbonate transport system substrate-binding protein